MNYFPTYLAMGLSFCNRKEELKRVIKDIEDGAPILLISPRRYGKTSLAVRALEKTKLPYAHVDLYKAFSEEDVARFILTGVGFLLGQLETTPKKLLGLAGDFFSRLNIQVGYHGTSVALSFKDKNPQNLTEILLATLEKLNELALEKNKKVILFLDEFQMVGEVSIEHAIEAVLREVAQKSQGLVFIFSGSNRHLMEQMFNDKKRPFYKMCDQISLERIAEQEYLPQIQKAAVEKWGQELESGLISKILMLTERHPYYVNKLCSMLWQNEISPTEKSIETTWIGLILENKSITERELSLLPLSQRKLLLFIAEQGKMENAFTRESMEGMNLSQGGVQNALKNLLKSDYVYKDKKGHYYILDPLLKSTLSMELALGG